MFASARERESNRSRLTLLLLISLIISILYFIVSPYRFIPFRYNLTLGQIADKDITAPFEFAIYKSEEMLQKEQDAEVAKVKPIYKVSEDLKFNAQKNLDFIMQQFLEFVIADTLETIDQKLKKNGYQLSSTSIKYLLNNEKRNQLYNILTEEYNRIFNIGIYPSSYTDQKIKIIRGNRITEYSLSRLYSLSEAKDKLLAKFNKVDKKSVAQELSGLILLENIVIDQDMTRLEAQKAREKVPLTIGKVLKNERIISKNLKISSIDLMKLNSLQKAQKQQNLHKTLLELLISTVGTFIFTFFILLIFYYYLLLFQPPDMSSYFRLVIIGGSVLLSVILTIIVNNVLEVPALLIPMSFSVLLIAFIFSPIVAIVFNFVNFLFIVQFLNWSFLYPTLLSITTISGLIILKRMNKKQDFYPLLLYLLISFLILHLAVTLIRFESAANFLTQMLYGMISLILSIIGVILIVPIVESKLNLATKRILLELLDFENELLKKLAALTPGTYHHSLIVGNLAESAAESIGAHHLLARVGSYYHDIGKTENPQLFIENNPDSKEIHDNMLANESAILIRKHIAVGIEMARKYNLPQPVIDIIQQHHGDSQIKYFYNKARETNLEVDEEHFYYPGPKPQSKEASIVMIADIVESRTKSSDDFSESNIRNILDSTVKRLIEEKQLDESPLSIKELNKIKSQMLPIIMGVYRKRLEYPE